MFLLEASAMSSGINTQMSSKSLQNVDTCMRLLIEVLMHVLSASIYTEKVRLYRFSERNAKPLLYQESPYIFSMSSVMTVSGV